MKNFFLFLGLFFAFCNIAKAQDITKNIANTDNCEQLILPAQKTEVPLGQFFADAHNAGIVSHCFTNKIKQNTTP